MIECGRKEDLLSGIGITMFIVGVSIGFNGWSGTQI